MFDVQSRSADDKRRCGPPVVIAGTKVMGWWGRDREKRRHRNPIRLLLTGTLALYVFVPAFLLRRRSSKQRTSQCKRHLRLCFWICCRPASLRPHFRLGGATFNLMLGISLFTASRIGACFLMDASTLIGSRFIQRFGGCAGFVLVRALVGDVARRHIGFSLMNRMNNSRNMPVAATW